MPIAAVAGAVWGAHTIATVGFAAMSTFQVISAVGAIVSGIGAITGNETLMKIGAVAGLAGGIGAWAQGAGMLGGAAGAGGVPPNPDAGAIQGALNTPSPELANATQGLPGNQSLMNAGATEPVSSMMGTEGLAHATEPVASLTANLTAPSAELAPPQSMGGPAAQAGPLDLGVASGSRDPVASLMYAGDTTAGGYAGLNADSAKTLGGGASVNGGAALGSSTSGKGGILGTIESIFGFMEKNKTASQMLGNFVGGMFDSEKKAKTAYYESAAERVKAQTRNASAVPTMNMSVSQTRPIFNTQPMPYQGVSLMNAR